MHTRVSEQIIIGLGNGFSWTRPLPQTSVDFNENNTRKLHLKMTTRNILSQCVVTDLCNFFGRNFPFPRSKKKQPTHWHFGASRIKKEYTWWVKNWWKCLNIQRKQQSAAGAKQICTHFRLFCSPPPHESRVSGHTWRWEFHHSCYKSFL